MRHFDSAELPPQCLAELQFLDWLNIDTRIVHQPIVPGFDLQVCEAFAILYNKRGKHMIAK